MRLVTGLATVQGLSRWKIAIAITINRATLATATATRSERRRQTGCGLTRGRTSSAREAIEGSEAKDESGERRSLVPWRGTASGPASERAPRARRKPSKAALLARRWPAEKP